MRLFVRAAGFGRGYYWTEVTTEGTRDAGQIPVPHYFDLLRNQDSLTPSLSLYKSGTGYHVLCLGLSTRRNEPNRRVITNSLLLEATEEQLPRLFIAAVLAGESGPNPIFHPSFEQALDACIDHAESQHHYAVSAAELHRRIEELVRGVATAEDAEPVPDDVFFERLFTRNSPERRRELRAALCRYELPLLEIDAKPQLLLAVAGLEDAEKLCAAGAWIALSEKCAADTWAVYATPGQAGKRAWEQC